MSTEDDNQVECPDCAGGHTSAGWALRKLAALLLMAGKDAARSRKPHSWLQAVGIGSLSLDMTELSSALAGRSADRTFGHDAIDAWETSKKIVAAAGLPETWGLCKTCQGSGEILSQ